VTGTSRQDWHIVHLIEVPEAVPRLTRWFVEEWGPYYGPGGPGDAGSDLAACRGRDALPICLVALSAGEEVLGTAALKSDSVGSELGVGPWLAAVLVGEDHRGQGVGTALVEAIEAEARRLGFASIYSSTDSAAGMLERRGWQAFGTVESLRGPATVYRRRFKDAGRQA
jgi:GNAT superfamily N-acetyltransferase